MMYRDHRQTATVDRLVKYSPRAAEYVGMELVTGRVQAEQRLKQLLVARRLRKSEEEAVPLIQTTELKQRGFRTVRGASFVVVVCIYVIELSACDATGAFPQSMVTEASHALCAFVDSNPLQRMQYSGKEWLASRSYVEEGVICCAEHERASLAVRVRLLTANLF